MGEITELQQHNKELLTRIDELQSEVKLLNEDLQQRDDRIDKLNEVGVSVLSVRNVGNDRNNWNVLVCYVGNDVTLISLCHLFKSRSS